MKQLLSARLGVIIWLLSSMTGCERLAQVEKEVVPEGVQVARYGSWESPLTAEDVYGLSDDITELQSIDDGIYFIQSDAAQQGRKSVKKLNIDGTVTDVINADFDVRTRVNEYGGAPVLGIGQSLFASKFSDQRLYRIAPNQEAVALTPLKTRYADCIFQTRGARLICVQEDHRQTGEPVTRLVGINVSYADKTKTLVSGADFYSSPILSPDQTHMAWIAWQHPNMPWDKTELWMADVDPKGEIVNPHRLIADSKGSITQPIFSPDGILYFVADFNNWWNLYRMNAKGRAEIVYDHEAEFAVPDWKMGNHNYAFESPTSLIASYSSKGVAGLVRVNIDTGVAEPIDVDFAEITQVIKGFDGVYFVGAKETPEKGIYKVQGRMAQLIYSPPLPVMDDDYISRGESMSFKSGNKKTAYGYFYPPKNPDFRGKEGIRPPLLVMLHSGPTNKASRAFRRDIQYWTSRGIAVFDLNYRGSSGFGRRYRNSLYGNWGKYDAEDAVRAAGFLVNKGLVDGTKLSIKGFREEGLSALSALAFYNTFKAGVIYSGISNVALFEKETHKFEASYIKHLVGKDNYYHDHTALFYLKGLAEPLLFIQGLNDIMIPAEQSKFIYKELKDKGVPIAYMEFKGDSPNLVTMKSKIEILHSELSFYGQVFGFTPAGNVTKLKFDNAKNLPPMLDK
ncbi:S9 family peptidase [Shewanella surugensis]|uniref:Prolyl oligopeptidase family serine peptidase n=1 Tax=Shewanella surugensis TaxID=212020 RepID=A0ABT0LG01_9GAMM|nr:prolyl oligopeptidase family serine peptidase [Shewanella surugensis]MCL1126590.1 prolyl oligopeptidase family serine peptidase [Shewanella surugensis]